MSRMHLTLSTLAVLAGGTALADVPRVAVDIAPVHSLVARVMDGVGTPDLIVQPGASPHAYSLRPSEAAALQEADLVFWVGDDLTPWIADAIATLSKGAAVTGLLDTDGTIRLEFRENALFEAHSHGDDAHAHGDHSHENHAHGTLGDDDHGHDDRDQHEAHGDHTHGHGDDGHDGHAHHTDAHGAHRNDTHADDAHGQSDRGHDDHAHGRYDAHAWLSPRNAASWLNVIAAQLSAADPENAGVYFANAAGARAELATLTDEVNALLDPVRAGRFIAFHDAYQYFETDFDVVAAGAISLSDASDPSPARIAEIQQRIEDQGIDCVLSEPQFNAGLVATVLSGTAAETGIVDPMGSDLTPGPALYPQLIRNLASTLAECM